jgi:hypothetical protein
MGGGGGNVAENSEPNIPRRQHRVKEQYTNQLKNIEMQVQC